MALDSIISLNSDLYTYEYFLQSDVCRLCWSKNADREISQKFSTDSDDINTGISYKIQDCLGLDMDLEICPKNACNNCFNKVENFYDFKTFCRENDRKLREIIENQISIEIEGTPCDVKLEKIDDFPNLDIFESKTESLDGFLDCLQSDSETDIKNPKTKKVKVKNKKYQTKRSPTYCNICRKDFESKEMFTQHNSEAHGIEDNGQFKCFGCEKRFKSRRRRLGHEINFCKGLKDGYRCSFCDRFLPKRGMYEAHMRDHRDNVAVDLPEDIFKCKKCNEVFKTKDSLKSHTVVHETQKNFVCESCGRVFTRQDYLHKHKLTHTGVKQHACPHCGFRAAQRSSLIVHIRKHTGERPYSCDVCPQRCVSSSNLRAHRRRHLGHKNYQCNICSKTFGYKISLEEHVASTHERSQSHPCPHCGATYTRIRGLRRHLLAKHGKNSKESKNDKDIFLKIVTDDKDNGVKEVTYQLKEDEFVLKSQDQVFVV